MRYYSKILPWLLILCLSISLLLGCRQESEDETTPTQEESQAQIELELLQAEYDELIFDYNDLENELEAKLAEFDKLSAAYDELSTQYDALSAEHGRLSAKYDELSAEYDALTYEPETITEEEAEQAVFELINRERLANRLTELEWNDDLHWWAKLHSDYMKEKKRLEYAYNDQVWWQEVFRAASYGTADKIANAALTIWKDNLYFEKNFLSEHAIYGAVAVSKSGEVFYITFFAAIEA